MYPLGLSGTAVWRRPGYNGGMADQRPTRRDFLRGRAALGAAADAVEASIDSVVGQETKETPKPLERSQVLVMSRRAMACEFELRLNTRHQRHDTEAGMAALDLVEQLEDQLTVYRQTSELIEINRVAAKVAMPVEAELFGLLQLCDRLHGETDGAFDLTVGPLSRVWGFSKRQGAVPEEADRAEALDRVGWRHVRLDSEEQTVRFLRDGVDLNVNSIGKGYALDRAGRLLGEWGVNESLMHGGSSTLLARGDNKSQPDGGWLAGVRNPLRPAEHLAQFTLRDEALSTSGAGTQFFEHEGKRFGHLIDPRTGWPAEGLYSATVIAPTAAEADALSTACYLLGVEGTERLCGRRAELKALLVAPSESGEPRVHAFNLDQTDWSPKGT